jgi:hypothetical protein
MERNFWLGKIPAFSKGFSSENRSIQALGRDRFRFLLPGPRPKTGSPRSVPVTEHFKKLLPALSLWKPRYFCKKTLAIFFGIFYDGRKIKP